MSCLDQVTLDQVTLDTKIGNGQARPGDKLVRSDQQNPNGHVRSADKEMVTLDQK